MRCICLLSDSDFTMKIDIYISILMCMVAKLFYLSSCIIQPPFTNCILNIPLDYQYSSISKPRELGKHLVQPLTLKNELNCVCSGT